MPDRSGLRRVLAAATLFLVGLNLRAALTALGPVLPEIMHATGLSAGGAGVLTTVPVICLGLLAGFAPWLARRLGADWALFALMLLLAAGCLMRLVGDSAALIASGLVVGAAIGMGNVLMPGMVKRDFADKPALMTGIYTMAMCISAAIGTAMSVPIANWLGGWPQGIAFWAAPALLAAAVLLARGNSHTGAPMRLAPVPGLWRNRLAWQLTVAMGMQSTFTYIIFAWLPPLLRDRGLSPVDAGLVAALSSGTQMLTSLAAPLIASRGRDQRWALPVLLAAGFSGFLLALHGPLHLAWAGSMLMGLGQGGTFAVSMMLVVLRSPDARVAAQLSSMSQSVGYTLTGLGPMIVGLAHDIAGNWSVLTPTIGGIVVIGALAGHAAGRDRLIVLAPPE
jgi:MFS transporter, CP family, cyanate transporter